MTMDPTTAAMAAAYGYNGTTQFALGLNDAHGQDAHQSPNEVISSFVKIIIYLSIKSGKCEIILLCSHISSS